MEWDFQSGIGPSTRQRSADSRIAALEAVDQSVYAFHKFSDRYTLWTPLTHSFRDEEDSDSITTLQHNHWVGFNGSSLLSDVAGHVRNKLEWYQSGTSERSLAVAQHSSRLCWFTV